MGVGLLYGSSQYKGDLADDDEGLYEHLRPMKGISFSYSQGKFFNFKTSYISTSLEAYDRNSNSTSRRLRNLHFRSSLQELSVTTEFYPIALLTKKNTWFKPYLKTGFAFFKFNPQGEYDGKWYDLQPMHTEGQGYPNSGIKPYSLYQASHPFGIGFKIDYKQFSFNYEIMPRNTNSDYLDDVSQNYYDLDQIRKYGSDAAAKLAYQVTDWDIENKAPIVGGTQRGNATNDDWYIIHQVGIYYNFSIKKEKTESKNTAIENQLLIPKK
jgi:hypothetical protein